MPGIYPVNDRPEDLQINFKYIQRQVCYYMYQTYNPDALDDEQVQAIQEIVDEGIRSYIYPPILPPQYALGAQHTHEWSFMRPVWVLQTEADQRRYLLPADFERPISDLAYTSTEGDFFAPIKFTSAARLFKLEYQDEFTTFPQYAAIEPREPTGNAPQLQQLVLHPTPDAQYTLTLQYQAVARRLTEENPYPPGGQMHGPGFLASCLAVAELRKNGADGPMFNKFMEKLSSNVARDTERAAQLLGYNGNGGMTQPGRGSLRDAGGIYYNEVLYGNTAYSGE